MKKNKIVDIAMRWLFTVCGFLSIIFVIVITAFLVSSGVPAIGEIGIREFLFGTTWASTAKNPEYGILPFILSSVAARLSAQAHEKKVHFAVNGKKAEIMGVRKILDEIIFNLCDNAIKYNKENGEVTVSVINNEKSVIVSVTDTGIGIPAQQQDRVFERFYRVDKARSKSIGGTGLGLSIVKHGAMYHKAQITLESKENIGTKITVCFPK